MKIYIGADHAGYELKENFKTYLTGLGLEVIDKGAFELNNEDDYPDFIRPVSEAVAEDWKNDKSLESFGIIIGGSGQGEAMCANRTKGVRASVYYGHELNMIKTTRKHNNANILSLGARFISVDEAKEAVNLFINTPFSKDERHVRRINKF